MSWRLSPRPSLLPPPSCSWNLPEPQSLGSPLRGGSPRTPAREPRLLIPIQAQLQGHPAEGPAPTPQPNSPPLVTALPTARSHLLTGLPRAPSSSPRRAHWGRSPRTGPLRTCPPMWETGGGVSGALSTPATSLVLLPVPSAPTPPPRNLGRCQATSGPFALGRWQVLIATSRAPWSGPRSPTPG